MPTGFEAQPRDGRGANSASPAGYDEARLLAACSGALDRTVADIQAAIRIPGVSKTGQGLDAMAAWVADHLEALGADVTRHPGRIAPIVEGFAPSYDAAGELIFYTLYDVQPAPDEGWSSPPFAAELVDQGGRRRLVGRGAFNSKGPLVAFLSVVRLFREASVRLPVAIRFLIEGEEEIGSPSLLPFVTANKARLAQSDGVLIPYLGTNARGETPIRLGFKGLGFLELTVEGGEWGGPAKHDIHAMHGAWVASPGWELVQALASLRDRDGMPTIDGWEVTDWWTKADDALVEEAARTLQPDAFMEELGISRFSGSGDFAEQLTRLMRMPGLNLDGLWVGEAAAHETPATLVPRRARACLDMRFVPGMDPSEAERLVRAHLDRRGFRHVEAKVTDAYPASRCDPDEPVVAALVEACRQTADKIVLLPIHAGAAPLYVFSDVLGVPYAFGGLGSGGRSHAPDEYLDVESLVDHMRATVRFLFRFAERLEREGASRRSRSPC